jgi:hypothetical protein
VSGTEYNGHCYFALSTAVDWQTAGAQCESAAANAHLVTITSAEEQSTVAEAFFPATNDYWMGLSLADLGDPPNRCTRDPGSCPFEWITGESVTYTFWIDYGTDEEPNYTGACVRARAEYDAAWADIGCTDEYPALCEVE